MYEPSTDEPLFSLKRLFNATRLFFYFVVHDPAYTHTLLFYLMYYRREDALFRKQERKSTSA